MDYDVATDDDATVVEAGSITSMREELASCECIKLSKVFCWIQHSIADSVCFLVCLSVCLSVCRKHNSVCLFVYLDVRVWYGST